MKRHLCLTATGLGMAVGIWLLAASNSQSAAEGDDVKAAIVGLANGKGDPAAIAKKNELGEVMHLFKLRTRQGKEPDKNAMGVGEKVGAISPDGIEAKLIGLAKRTDKADVAKNSDAYAKMAAITLAIAKVTDVHVPEAKAGKSPAAWKKNVAEMKAGASDLSDAAKAGSAEKVKTASMRLVGACNECHTVFRDN